MPKSATKAADNVFYKARIEASSWNERLKSREGTAEETGVDRTRIAYIELNTVIPHPEEVLMLAETYNAPELTNYFCSKMCPLGIKTISSIETTKFERIVLQLLNSCSQFEFMMGELIEIACDGVIDDTEAEQMENIMEVLSNVAKHIEELKINFKKQSNS